MGIQVAIRHKTNYNYDRAIKLWPQIIRLRPAPHSRTKILGYSLNISPKNHFINWMQDPFGNFQARVVFPDLVKELVIEVEVIADMVSINPFDFFLDEYAEKFPFQYDDLLSRELAPYLEINESGPKLLALFDACKAYKGQNSVDFLVAVNRKVYELIDYTIRMETGIQSCEKTLELKLGSCRDSAWVLVQLLRHFGLAARFVSGYLVQLKSDIKVLDGPSGPEKDFTDLHAWAEVFIPGAGWVGLDATSGLLAGEGHIPLACTPQPESAAPLTGSTEPAQVQFGFINEVERIYEAPRVTKPYTEAQLKAIRSCGFKVDEILEAGDCRLTMGGEPTFISAGDMESEQWNEAADGDDKKIYAYELAVRLKNIFGKDGLIHCGQGKWYPGEPIPRWQYAIYWRKGQELLWKNDKTLANPLIEGKCVEGDGKLFLENLARALGVNPKYAVPAYEDRYYYLWEEENLPIDFDKTNAGKDTKIERKTLLELLKKGIEKPAGYVLPLKKDLKSDKWKTCEWKFERDSLFLIPGNSQLGLRLPLDKLPKVKEGDEDIVIPPSTIENDIPVLGYSEGQNLILRRKEKDETSSESSEKVIRTAISIEVKNGNLHIFLPPCEEINHFMDLIYAIQDTAETLGMQVVLEGYQPPHHNDLTKLVVAPDPGVIEVNVHPSSSWGELLDIYDAIFKESEEVGLGTNKFMLDGKHTGTGGGNHITLGGFTPADSPLLRRPDLLRSMINFWQNHPGLSYLFSSSFIGPTSQAPRVDEGRPDIIYELEIAFSELERHNDPPFWLVDRLFRNLLTDLTGNTHRAEFCIDKLYNPDSSTGRLGILELRGFDMPPHKEMCIVQLLLIRSLVATFWKTPYKNKLIDWGTELHDKFMMHHYVREDMHEVVDYINKEGIGFDKKWLDVFLDFKFPVYGSVNIKGINITLRAGIEPWIVLGEEMSSTGTARFVDSSLERIEVLVEDISSDRYILLCNSVQVPLVKTSYQGKYIAAIRYKAWDPPSALHPTIGVNTPLVFDLYDTWNNRSIGGCTYHVVHPGGRSYDTFPVNSLEAESRRTTRFWDFNHSPQSNATISNPSKKFSKESNYVVAHDQFKEDIEVKQVPVSRNFPHTLDLRRL